MTATPAILAFLSHATSSHLHTASSSIANTATTFWSVTLTFQTRRPAPRMSAASALPIIVAVIADL
jgi:hypothetical protein